MFDILDSWDRVLTRFLHVGLFYWCNPLLSMMDPIHILDTHRIILSFPSTYLKFKNTWYAHPFICNIFSVVALSIFGCRIRGLLNVFVTLPYISSYSGSLMLVTIYHIIKLPHCARSRCFLRLTQIVSIHHDKVMLVKTNYSWQSGVA